MLLSARATRSLALRGLAARGLVRPARGLATKQELTLSETDADGVATITLNNPKRLNGWTAPMMLSLFDRFEAAAADDSVKAVVLTGAGSYYCAGVDLSSTLKPMWPKQLREMIYTQNKLVFDTFLNFPKPLCVAVNGPAIGASVTTATLADGVVAAEAATFSTPFSRLGVPPEGCSSVHFAALMGADNAARMLGPEGWAPTGKEAAAANLVDECVPDADLLDAARAKCHAWLADPAYEKAHRGDGDTAKLLQVNDKESQDLADAFLDYPFLEAQAAFLKKKGKNSAMFDVLIATRPAWKLLL